MKSVPLLDVADNVTCRPAAFDGTRTYYATADVEKQNLLEGIPVTYRERPSRANLVAVHDDILFAKMQATDKIIHINGEAENAIFSTGFFNLRPHPTCLHSRYLFWFLRSSVFQNAKDQRCTGATQRALTLSGLQEIEIPLPETIEEQKQIAAILDAADSIRHKRKKTIAMTGSVLSSAFLQMFGDPLKNPFGFSTDRIDKHLSKERSGTQSGPFGSVLKKHEYTDSGIPVWGVDNVQSNEFVDTAKLFISEEKFEHLKRYNVEPGDILISRAGTVGRVCIAEPKVDKSIISTNLVRVVLDSKTLLPEYFVSLFTYFPHRLGALKANNKKNAFTFLNPKTLKALEIVIPPVKLQKEYRLLKHAMKSQIAKAEKQLEEMNQLTASLSQRAFRGEL